MPKPGKTSEFWQRLVESRESKGLATDQEAIAKSLKMWQSAVTKWKTGKGLPTLANAIKLATDADVCVEWLLTGRLPRKPAPPADPQLAKLLGFWDKLLPETVDQVVGYAVYLRSVQVTALPERIRQIHEKELPEANRKAQKRAPHRGTAAD